MQTDNTDKCREALRALATGRLEDWHGLPPTCSRQRAEEVFGPSEPGADGTGIVEGQALAFRRYPPGGTMPNGGMLWLEGDRILAIELYKPALTQPLADILGPAEEIAVSNLRSSGLQWIYASRGLTAHLSGSGALFRIYAYPATTLKEYRESWISRVQIRRIPLNPETA